MTTRVKIQTTVTAKVDETWDFLIDDDAKLPEAPEDLFAFLQAHARMIDAENTDVHDEENDREVIDVDIDREWLPWIP